MNAPFGQTAFQQASPVAWLSDRMLRAGGLVVVQVETYFDESGSHDGSPILCVAGYVIDKSQLADLDREWQEVLAWKGLPHFHMVDCAHGDGAFGNLTKAERIQVEAKMIGIIKRRTIRGLAVSVIPSEFDHFFPVHPLLGSPYSFCAHMLLAGVSRWIDSHSEVERAAYFFEAGHKSQSEANAIMTLLFRNAAAKQRHRYAGHGFVEKEASPAIQAADLLAWQWFTDRKHEMGGGVRRKDCASLLDHPHGSVHLGPDKLAQLAARFANAMPDAETFERLYLGDPKPQRGR